MIHVIRNGQQEGPYQEEEVRRKLSAGQFSLTDYGWREGLPNWIKLGALLGIESVPAPPPVTGPTPPPLPDWVTSTTPRTASPAGPRRILSRLVVPVLGLLGALCDISLARAILGKIDALHTDVSSIPWYWQLAIKWLYQQWGDHFVENAAFVGHILYACGLVGGLCAVIFFLRRHTKILAGILISCGLAPLLSEFTRPLTFVGFLMALAGFFGLFVREKTVVGPNKV